MRPWVPPGRGSATSPGTGLKKQHQPEHSGHRGQVVGLACGNVCTDSIEGPGTAEHVGGDEGGGRQGTHGAGGSAGSELRARGAAVAVAAVVGTALLCQQVPPRQRHGTSLVQNCPHLCMSMPASVCDQKVTINARTG